MSSADNPGAGLDGLGQASEPPGGQVHAQLVEALILLLIEKGVLTKNDALSVVQTVAQVQGGVTDEGGERGTQAAALEKLRRMYQSFEALADRPGALLAEGENVYQLRPPIYGDRPEFPADD